jgi:hypothetical protein
MSRSGRPGLRDQYAMRSPCGETLGPTASVVTTRRLAPLSTFRAQSSAEPMRLMGSTMASVLTSSSRASCDQVGSWPRSLTRRTDSPVASMM